MKDNNKGGHGTLMEQSRRLVNLNQLEVFLGVIVAVITIATAVGTYYILPYRVSELEKALAQTQGEMRVLREASIIDRELLVRIDERLRQVQRALKIPTDESKQ